MFKAKDITANVLLLHAENDKRVPIRHCELMYKALVSNDKTAQFHVVKNGHHGAYGKDWEGTEEMVLEYLKRN